MASWGGDGAVLAQAEGSDAAFAMQLKHGELRKRR
jgi:hypothetical protein